MNVRTTVLLALGLFAGCGVPSLRAPKTLFSIVPTAHDRALARTVLEGEGDSLFLPARRLDSLALAFATVRRVDSLSAAELTDYGIDRFDSEIILWLGFPGGDSSVRRLADSLAHCAGLVAGPSAPTVWDQHTAVPLPRTCWGALERALAPVNDAVVTIRGFEAQLLSLSVTIPPPVDRYVLIKRVKDFTGLTRGVQLNGIVVGGSGREMTREGEIWRFRFMRGYGDCESGCIHKRIYEYRFDSRTGRAWKHSESGDPYPPPSAKDAS